jgi:hypothetical protein
VAPAGLLPLRTYILQGPSAAAHRNAPTGLTLAQAQLGLRRARHRERVSSRPSGERSCPRGTGAVAPSLQVNNEPEQQSRCYEAWVLGRASDAGVEVVTLWYSWRALLPCGWDLGGEMVVRDLSIEIALIAHAENESALPQPSLLVLPVRWGQPMPRCAYLHVQELSAQALTRD